MGYLTELSVNFGIPIFLIIIGSVWSLIWKLIAFWKSARNGQIVWFIVFGFVHTLGIIEIIYLLFFSNLKAEKISKKKKKSKKN